MAAADAENRRGAIVFAGGMALGAYQGGAYERFQRANAFDVDWLAGASVGAINAALIAGNAPEHRIARLREFWCEPGGWQRFQLPSTNLRYAQNWLSAIQTRLMGAPGLFRPRTPGLPFDDFKSLYDLAPTQRRIARLIDFKRLNSGELRLTVATTDMETGELVLFDTARETITIDHLMASCGMIPEFAPVAIAGRLLVDGGLSANAPFEPIVSDETQRVVFILDLFARDGPRPRSLTAALARKNELMFGNQTLRRLEFWRDTRSDRASAVVYLSYRASPDEADSEKLFDVSSASAAERWQFGARDMEAALAQVSSKDVSGLIVVRR